MTIDLMYGKSKFLNLEYMKFIHTFLCQLIQLPTYKEDSKAQKSAYF